MPQLTSSSLWWELIDKQDWLKTHFSEMSQGCIFYMRLVFIYIKFTVAMLLLLLSFTVWFFPSIICISHTIPLMIKTLTTNFPYVLYLLEDAKILHHIAQRSNHHNQATPPFINSILLHIQQSRKPFLPLPLHLRNEVPENISQLVS